MSKSSLGNWISRIWKDPVASKLIAALIIATVSGVWGYFYFSEKKEVIIVEKDGQFYERTFLKKEKISQINGRFLGDLLDGAISIFWHEGYDFIYSGYYSYYFPTNGKRILHGKFKFELNDLEFDPLFTGDTLGYKIVYSGKFEHGKLSGETFHEFLDLGIDSYADYRIFTYYDGESDKCFKAVFEGAIGDPMPKSKYTFDNPEDCNLDNIRKMAADRYYQNN